MAAAPPRLVPGVISQHAEMAAHLFEVRDLLIRGPHVKLKHLLRIDNRLAAHLDGLAISGDAGVSFCLRALDNPTPGVIFALTVGALERHDRPGLLRLHSVTGVVPEARRGLVAAFGWVEPRILQGVVAQFLASNDRLIRLVAVAACGLHRVDPGLTSARLITDMDPVVRARALRTAGEIGCCEVIPVCESALRDDDPEIQFWAAWSAVLLGGRGVALDALARAGRTDCSRRARAARLALQTMKTSDAHRMLQELAVDPKQLPWLIQGSGIVGDPSYAEWLIGHMSADRLARTAGEAFSDITGADLALLDLERKPPEYFESGPNDEPHDPDVAMDPDDGLPWPDQKKVQAWWAANGPRFQKGTRYFIGAPVTHQHCIDVLKNGYQRQRILAAHYLCLLNPGTPLFNTSAPAWRQQRMLAQMH